MRFTDRAIGIAFGVLLGLVIVILFVFLGSGHTIDAPSLSGDDQPRTRQTGTGPAEPAKPNP